MGILRVGTIETQNLKYDSDSPALSFNNDGSMSITQNDAYVDFSSELQVGVSNSSYDDLTGSTLNSSTTNTTKAYAYKISDKLVWLSMYLYKNPYASGYGSSNSYGWAMKLPNSAVGSSGLKITGASAYQFIPAGYTGMNGSNLHDAAGNIRWQANHSHMLFMYGPNWGTNWASGSIEFAATGILHLA